MCSTSSCHSILVTWKIVYNGHSHSCYISHAKHGCASQSQCFQSRSEGIYYLWNYPTIERSVLLWSGLFTNYVTTWLVHILYWILIRNWYIGYSQLGPLVLILNAWSDGPWNWLGVRNQNTWCTSKKTYWVGGTVSIFGKWPRPRGKTHCCAKSVDCCSSWVFVQGWTGS